MTSTLSNIRLGLTSSHQCNYLPNEQERIAIVMDEVVHTSQGYEMLMANGFRRSGSTIYRPFCETCQACQPIRISVQQFQPSKSQKRLIAKARSLTWKMKHELDHDWFALYSKYIVERHSNGSMYPPKKEDFSQFSSANWLNTGFLHIYDEQTLIAIAVTDLLDNAGSAFYTFFDPSYPISLGTLGVLIQLEWCKQNHKPWLYLGYQVDDCPAMNYKTRFKPHQKLVNQSWQG